MRDLRHFLDAHNGDEARAVLAFMAANPDVRPNRIALGLELIDIERCYPLTMAFLAQLDEVVICR